jgi:transcriptional regulator with XRE-family HTH domain
VKTQSDVTFAHNLYRLRTAASLTGAELADAAGLTRQAIALLESGQRAPSWATVCALADALGVATDEFRAELPPLVV